MKIAAALATVACVSLVQAQTTVGDLDARVMSIVRAAMAPALPYPASDESGSLPADEVSAAPWMVRPLQPGDRVLEVLANPLNPEHQARSAKAMQQIEQAIETAQRRSQAQYERAIADAQRTGKSQDVEGITLGDEGVAGARIDADGHVIIDVDFNKSSYAFTVASTIEPTSTPGGNVPGAVAVLSVPAHVYRDRTSAPNDDRFCVAETQVFFGALAAPTVKRRTGANFDVTAIESSPLTSSPVRTIVIRLRGNEQLIGEIVRKTDWPQVMGLLRP